MNKKNDNIYYLQERSVAKTKIFIIASGLWILTLFLLLIYLEKGINMEFAKVFLVIILFWLIILIVIKNRNSKVINYKNIVNTGIKVEGHIKTFKKVYYPREKTTPMISYILIISYKDPNTGVEKELETPYVNFNPLKDLVSKKCNVYVDGERAYATDFEVNQGVNNNIWNKDELEYYNKQIDLERKIDIATLPITIIEIIFFILGFYWFIMNLLNK